MTREVVLTATAQRQMNAAADWYAEQNLSVAAKWLNGLIQELLGRLLEVVFPESKKPRCSLSDLIDPDLVVMPEDRD